MGATETFLKLVGGMDDKVTFIQIGLNEINEPLEVQTTDGYIFGPIGFPRELKYVSHVE